MARPAPAKTPTVAVARALRSLGLTQGRGKDFTVTGMYHRGERAYTYVVFYRPEADQVAADAAQDIETLTAESGFPFRVRVHHSSDGKPFVSVSNH